MAYTTTANLRLLTNLVVADIADADVTSLITQATYQLNSDINILVKREKVDTLDNTRQNEINGTNTVYYVRNWRHYLGDMDNDGGIDTGDATVYQVAADGTETTLTVSAIDSDDGKITLDSAPASGVTLYITYVWCYKDPDTPDKLIELACTNLTAAYAWEKINRGLSPQQVYGNVRLMKDRAASNEYYQRYKELVDKINAGNSVLYTEAPII